LPRGATPPMIFGHGDFLCTPFRPMAGSLTKNDTILAACAVHPDRFLVSPCSGDPQVLVAGLLTDPDNAVWEVWRGDAFLGILLLDRIVARVDARLQFVFFDDELASKAPLLNDFVARCFSEFELAPTDFRGADTHDDIDGICAAQARLQRRRRAHRGVLRRHPLA
jgi:hypothetical protein